MVLTPSLKTNHLAKTFITELNFSAGTKPVKRKMYEKKNNSEDEYKTNQPRINWENFYKQNDSESI